MQNTPLILSVSDMLQQYQGYSIYVFNPDADPTLIRNDRFEKLAKSLGASHVIFTVMDTDAGKYLYVKGFQKIPTKI